MEEFLSGLYPRFALNGSKEEEPGWFGGSDGV